MRKGISVSPGVVVGVVHRIEPILGGGEPQLLADAGMIAAEIERFDHAREQSSSELQSIVSKVAEQLGPSEAEIFQSHLSIVNDAGLKDRVREVIEARRYTAASALQEVLQDFAAKFARHEQELFRERIADLRDVIARIAAHLNARPQTTRSTAELGNGGNGDPTVLVAHEILPSQAMSLGDMPIAGIVTEIGGGTSHVAILSRSRGIPAVSGCAGIASEVHTGDPIIVDGREGHVIVRPDPDTIAFYRTVQREYVDLKDRLILNKDQPAVSADGVQVELLANINNAADAAAGVKVGATGVGLFRTEYLFLTHQDLPDEEEQYQHYRRVIEAAPGRTVAIRTLDLGGDKTVPYLGNRSEPNPFMGWRSIRLTFEHPRLFEHQIRAILRAGQHGRVSMLFPMLTTLEELRHVNKIVEETKLSLRKEQVPFGEDMKTGVMIEVPAAAVCIDAILRETDFISIGSNDLIQYLVAADRDNPKVAHLCEPLSPAIFRVLQTVFDACKRTGTPVTVCGEMAGQPRAVLVLFGLGLRRFSMSPAFVPTIKALLRSVTTAQAERFAHHVLQLKTSEEIRKYLTERLHEISSSLELLDST